MTVVSTADLGERRTLKAGAGIALDVTQPGAVIVSASGPSILPDTVPKTASQSLASNTTPQADTQLFKTLEPGTYFMQAFLRVTLGTAASGFKWRWDHNLTGNLSWPVQTRYRSSAGNEVYAAAQNIGNPGTEISLPAVPGASSYAEFFIHCNLIISSTRTVRLLWSQAASQVTNTTVQGGSWLSFTKLF